MFRIGNRLDAGDLVVGEGKADHDTQLAAEGHGETDRTVDERRLGSLRATLESVGDRGRAADLRLPTHPHGNRVGAEDDIGIEHGEQRFDYHAPVCAGDTLRFESKVSDIYDKKGGALEFVVNDTKVTNQLGQHVADLHAVIVVRHG